jgi:hypothetical protein
MISLQGSLKTCKADTAWAERLQSNRFEDPENMICIPWGGRDLVGRPAHVDSFYTKSAGCNTPADRVNVENTLRPQYMETTSVDAYGFRSDLYDGNKSPLCRATPTTASCAPTALPPGLCPFYPYDWSVPDFAGISKYSRVSQFLQHQMKSYEMLDASGFG